MNLYFYIKDSKKQINLWKSPNSDIESVKPIVYTRTFNLPNGETITTNQLIQIRNILYYDVYITQSLNSSLRQGANFNRENCKIYMQLPEDSTYMEYSSTQDFGVSSNGVIRVNCNKYNSAGKQPSSGSYWVILDIDSGYSTSKMKVTTTLDNITFENAVNEVDQNSDFTFNFSASPGYEIDTLTTNLGSVNIAGDKLTATITGKATDNIIINGSATQVQAIYTVTYNLNNITCTNPVNTVVENGSFNLSFVPAGGYKIDTLTSNIGIVTIAENKKSAAIVGTASGNILITGSSTLEKHYVKISSTLNNCYCSYENNEEINPTKACEIIADSGYIFPVQIHYPYTAIINDVEVVKYATVIDNGYRLNFDFSFESGISTIILNDEYTAVKEEDNISDFVNTYYVTKQTLKELAKARFMKLSTESGATYKDLGEFIVGLYILPLGIPGKLIASEQNIKLGYEDSRVPANVINAYKWEYDLGVITIPTKYDNAYDFVKTDVFLNAPFFDQQQLPIYTIGHDLHITMLFDCYSGNATLLVKDTFTNSYIVNKTQKIVIDIPYVQTGLNSVFNKLGNTNINPLIDTCFVSVIRNTPYNNDNDEYGKNQKASVVIGSIQGYAEFSKSTVISTIATDTELEMITRLLANGVYIN